MAVTTRPRGLTTVAPEPVIVPLPIAEPIALPTCEPVAAKPQPGEEMAVPTDPDMAEVTAAPQPTVVPRRFAALG